MRKTYIDGLLRAIQLIEDCQKNTFKSNVIAAVGMEQVKNIIEEEIKIHKKGDYYENTRDRSARGFKNR